MSVATVSYLFPANSSRRAFPDPPVYEGRNTKRVGDRSEAAVLAALAERGYLVSVPFGENHRYDLVVDDGTRLLRVQVKTGRMFRGSIAFRCCSTHQHRRSGPTASRPYFGEVDFIAVYCRENGKIYMVPESEIVRTTAHLRLVPTINRQDRNIRWAERYEL